MKVREPRDRYAYAINLSREFFGFDGPVDEEDIDDAYKTYSAEYHPDVSDLPKGEANKKFKALGSARDVLKENITQDDSQRIRTAISTLEDVMSESSIDSIREETIRGSTGKTTRTSTGVSGAGERKRPDDFDLSDFGSVSGSERASLIREVALGYSVMLRYNAVQGLLKKGVTQEDFYEAVNDFIDESGEDDVSNPDYYEAVEDLVRDNVDPVVFVESIESVEEQLGQEYVPGASIDEIAEIIAMLVVDGKMSIGFEGMMAGNDRFRRPGEGNFRRAGSSRYRRPGGEGSRFRRE